MSTIERIDNITTSERLSAAELDAETERCARPHTIVMPARSRHECGTYQEAWLRRNELAWAQGLDPKEIPIEDDKGEVVP